MSDLSREQLIEFITGEVLRALGQQPEPEPECPEGCPWALVIGDPDILPPAVRRQYRFIRPGDGDGGWERIFITALSQTQLADIALGRSDGQVQQAVLCALLDGKAVTLYDAALGHRRHGPKASRALVQLLEGYVRTLQSFGVEVVQGTTTADRYQKTAAPGADLPGGVITEALAKSMVERTQEEVILVRAGTVLTPSAKDVFLHARRQVRPI